MDKALDQVVDVAVAKVLGNSSETPESLSQDPARRLVVDDISAPGSWGRELAQRPASIKTQDREADLLDEIHRLRLALIENANQVRRWRRLARSHRCDWRVVAEAIEARCNDALKVDRR